MPTAFTLSVNGRAHTVTTDPARPLLQILREDLGLTGTKYGCGEGQCGACTVLMDGRREHACLIPVKDAVGRQITTIEGLSSKGQLHPVQRIFMEEGAMQCGYCTSGMILATVALLRQNPTPSREEIVAWMNPHICRCCGYPRLLQAVQRAATELRQNP